MAEEIKSNGIKHHWPIVALACAVLVIFLIAMMTFQVKETEYAVVKTFGKAKTDANGIVLYEPGLHFKRPFIDQVWRHDKRIQCFELSKGHMEQLTTNDQLQIVVSTYVLWSIGDPAKFLKTLNSTEDVEEQLNAAVRNSRHSIVSRYKLADLVNTETGQSKIAEIEKALLDSLSQKMMDDFGIKVTKVGFRQLELPEMVSTKVFDRMRAERENHSQRLLAEGKSEAQKIRSEADKEASEILAKAEAEAKRIRGEGDSEAAKYYAVFKKNPELALFLRNLDALKGSISEKDTLILDTDTPPFNLLKPGAVNIPAQPNATDK